MADSTTTTYSFTLPEVGASADSWGTKLNANWSKVDDLFDGTVAVTGINLTTFKVDSVIVTASAAELNTLDGITATTTELNYTDGVTSNIQTQLDSMVEKSGDTMTGDLSLGDNVKAKFGAGDDLQIYHDGSHSYVRDSGTGHLKLQGTDVRIQSADGGENFLVADLNGAVRLYNDNTQKLQTTSTGVDVTGTVTADGLTVDGSTSTDGILIQNPLSGSFYNANVEFRRDTTLGGAKIQTERNSAGGVGLSFNCTVNNTAEVNGTYSKAMQINNNGDVSFFEDTGTTAKFQWDSSNETVYVGENEFPTSSLGKSAGRHALVHNGEPRLLIWDASTGSAGNQAHLMLGGKPTNSSTLFSGGSIRGGVEDGVGAKGYLAFDTIINDGGGSSERMRLDSSGNLLVGQTSSSQDGDAVVKTGQSATINRVRNLANGSSMDICVGSGLYNYWSGFLCVTHSDTGNGSYRTQTNFSVICNNQFPSFNTSVLHTADGAQARSFTITYVDNGIIRLTNTSGHTCKASMTFIGGGLNF